MPKNVHSLTDAQYAAIVLAILKRLVSRSDYYLAAMPPKNILGKDEASVSDVTDALQFAIDAVRNQAESNE